MRDRLPGAVSVRDARFLDPTLVAPEPAGAHGTPRSVSYASGGCPAIQPRAMSTHVPSSSHWRSNATSRSTRAGPVSELTCGRVPTAQGRGSEKRKTANVEHAIVVEIPKGSRNKYEMDHESGAIWLDRTLFTAMQYPADYGFFPDTLAEDGDPLDALVLLTNRPSPAATSWSAPSACSG